LKAERKMSSMKKSRRKLFMKDIAALRVIRGAGMFAAIHPKHSVIAYDTSLKELNERMKLVIKKSVREACSFFDIDACFVLYAPNDEGFYPHYHPSMDSGPVSPELADLELSASDETPYKDTSETINEFSQRLGLKATDVLMKAMQWGYSHLHLNMKLDNGLRDQLELVFQQVADLKKQGITVEPEDLAGDVHKKTIDQVKKKASEIVTAISHESFDSPHEQPPFQPVDLAPQEATIDGNHPSIRRTYTGFSRRDTRID
jgi:hypothetical protein